MAEKLPIAPWQDAARKAYGDGDYADMSTRDNLEACGDTLFKFVMIELSRREDCNSFAEAQGRIRRAIQDLEEVSDAIDRARREAIEKTRKRKA